MSWLWCVIGVAIGIVLRSVWPKFGKSRTPGRGVVIRIADEAEGRRILRQLKEMGGWDTDAEAVESAISFYRWALISEESGAFFFQPEGELTRRPIRILKNEVHFDE